jgi:hypothetical protein
MPTASIDRALDFHSNTSIDPDKVKTPVPGGMKFRIMLRLRQAGSDLTP